MRRLIVTGAVVAIVVAIPGGAEAADLASLPSWETVATPSVGEFTNELAGGYAGARDDAWAVGSALGRGVGGGQQPRTLLQRWDGATWSQVAPPSRPDGRVAQLNDVDGNGPDDVWAVGAAVAGTSVTGHRTVTMHWDGQSWTAVPSPNLGFADDVNELLGVTAIAPDDVWAVGRFASSTTYTDRRSILLHWDGTRWQIASHPCGEGLRSVAASATDDVWAIGGSAACYFNGSLWQAARPAPPPEPQRSVDLDDVAVVGPTEAWAVGRTIIPCGENICTRGEIQRWNGARWSRFATPGLDLRGIHAITGSNIWASSDDGLLQFDGQTWTRLPAPAGVRADVTASGPDDIWAVGSTNGGSPSKALIQHAPAFRTGSIVGDTNHAGALVSWIGPASGSVQVRNSFGEYEVVALPAGSYQLFVTADGCAPQSRDVVVTAGRILQEDFTLSC